jgi:hypothetical protein
VRDVFPIICSTRNNRWQYFSTAFLVSLAVFVVLTASCPAKEIGVVTRNRREPYIAIRCIQRLRMDRHTEFWCRIEPSAAIQARIAAIETKMGGCFIRCVIVFDCAGDIKHCFAHGWNKSPAQPTKNRCRLGVTRHTKIEERQGVPTQVLTSSCYALLSDAAARRPSSMRCGSVARISDSPIRAPCTPAAATRRISSSDRMPLSLITR